MAMFLSESTVLPVHPLQQTVSVTKKISNYIFRFEDKIGQGNFSKVYKGYHQLTNQQVAIKIIELSSVKSAKLQELLFSQIEVIQSLNHPNILKCYQVLKSENNCYIITELCNGGDLQSVLKRQKCLNEISAAPYICDVFKGLLYLGQRGIVHRDLKIANIFMHNGLCKIADFGFAKYTNKQIFFYTSQNFFDLDIGSPLYMSPEGMIQHMYGMKTDIWSFGIIMFELLHGKTPFSYCTTQYELKRAVVTPISYHSIRPDLSPQVRQLIMKCLIVDANQRPDALNLRSDPFLYGLINGMHEGMRFVKINEQHPIQTIQLGLPGQLQVNNHADQFRRVETLLNKLEHPINKIFYPQPIQNLKNESIPSLQYLKLQPAQQKSGRCFHSPSQPQIHIPLQFSTNSPTRVVGNMKNASKQNSVKHSQNKQQLNSNQKFSSKNLQYIQKTLDYPRSYQNIQTDSQIDLMMMPQIKYPQNGDRIKIHEECVQEQKKDSIDNFDKVSNSSWSHDHVGKKKFPKSLSQQNINKVQNNLVIMSSQNKVKEYPDPSVNKSTKGRIQGSFQSIKANRTGEKDKHLNRELLDSKSVHQSFTNKSLTNDGQKLNFNQDAAKSPKKFGEIIKGQKRHDANIKSIIKLQLIGNSGQKLAAQRPKIKSQIKPNQTSISKTSESPNKDRMIRHSIGDISSCNQSQKMNMNQSLNQPVTRSQFPAFIQQKQKQKHQLKRNLICTIMDFKQAVGFLHYCRLYYRFIAIFKKLMLFPEVNNYEFLSQCFSNFNQQIEIYWKYLLAALSELIENIRCKEIIYDGDSYKKKKMKEDKLKQVTEEYFRKYMEETNKNPTQNQRITTNHMQAISFAFMKEHNEHFWELLDRQYNRVVQLSRKTAQIGDNFIKNFRNVCYLAIRINQANQIIANCILLRNYKPLGNAMMENWLAQEFYGQDVYLKLKNNHFRKMNEANTLKNSETNDTETQNQSRAKYL